MKFEKISDNQIRCTLSSVDLNDRQLNVRELTYGTEKARTLFREMIQRASYELGFEAEDIPLMIETIPLAEDSIMLLITKMDDPEELDTRFAKFAPDDDDLDEDSSSPRSSAAEDRSADSVLQSAADNQSASLLRVFCFKSLDTVIAAAQVVSSVYQGCNSLYQNPDTKDLYLAVQKSSHSPEDFNKACNLLGEYGNRMPGSASTEAYFKEHLDSIVAGNALQVLKKL